MLSPLGGAEVHDVWSESVGDTFRIFVGHCGPDPRATLFVGDGNGLFGLTVDAVRMMQIPALIPSLLVVGIGYPGAATLIETVGKRVRDFTPSASHHFEGSGGAGEFHRFISSELRPWVADRYPEALNDVTYFGHSLGGLFGAYSLLTNPTTFDRYILSSPSLWWDHEMMFALERDRPNESELRAQIVFGIGSLETDAGRRAESVNLPIGHPAKPPSTHLDMVNDMRRFVAQLGSRNEPALELRSIEVADEFHATVPGIVLSRGLREFRIPASGTGVG